jgi:DNA-binding response OmpR family regulator
VTRKKILVVEDDADARLGYHVLLKHHNYEAFFGSDGFSAVTEARKHQPDLIILDLGLPAGDGFVVLDRLRSNTYLGLIPVIVVSAKDVAANKDRALNAGARAFLQKPWNDSDLLAKIRELLGEDAAAAAS